MILFIMTTTTQLVRIGHSPDPDDAFMFYALAKEKIPLRGFQIEHVVEDIESLNQRALRGELEVTAVSCHAYTYLTDRYVVMPSGASVGDNYGPILVARDHGPGTRIDKTVKGKRIAVPGKLTTAYLVLQLYEKDFEPVFVPFDQIFEAVLSGTVDFGLVIHEGQITYRQQGLQKILDLGEWWYQKTQLPLPLGVDVIRRDLEKKTIESFSKLFRSSIEYALSNRKEALRYAIQFGRGLEDEFNDRFVGMYVNDYTVDLGEKGKAALVRLFEEGHQRGILDRVVRPEFVA